ncbi:polyadenylate-binding protein-interacting protein 7 [Quercus suber]|uniref:Polyadenylate-binding protein-interacting protein 7 n=1 Tax=Quercus suber TaxID=58331 RepID=A0AAW0JT24_QUESU
MVFSPDSVTTLNPNAAEFVLFALRSSSGSTSTTDATTRLANSGTLGKALLKRSESSVSKIPDEEAHQCWCCQLSMIFYPSSRSWEKMSLKVLGTFLWWICPCMMMVKLQSFLLLQAVDGSLVSNKNYVHALLMLRFFASSYGEVLSSPRRGLLYDGNCRHDFVNDVLGKHAIVDNVEDNEMDPIEFCFG